MEHKYELFETLPDCSVRWHGCVCGTELALARVKGISKQTPTNVLRFSPARKKSWLVSMMDGAPAPGLLDVSVRADVEAIQKLAETFVSSFSQRASKVTVREGVHGSLIRDSSVCYRLAGSRISEQYRQFSPVGPLLHRRRQMKRATAVDPEQSPRSLEKASAISW